MSDIRVLNETTPATPPTGASTIFIDSADKTLKTVDDTGTIHSSSAAAFNVITGGTNITAAMIVGSGGTLAATGSGTIAATSTPASGVTGTTLASGVVTSSLTTVGTIATGTWHGTVVGPTYGGTGVNNGASTVTVGGNVEFSGASTFTGTLTGNTNVTFPTSGTLSTTTGTVTTSGSPASGNLSKFSSSSAITNGDLSGDVTTSGTLTSTVAKIAGTTVSGTTGTTNVVFSNSPTITTAALGSSTATTQTPGDNSTKLATTAYVQAAIVSLDIIASCKYATTAALATVIYNNGSSGVGATLTAVGLGAISIDGSTPSVADRLLIKNQASSFQNGVYVVTTVGSAGVAFILTRASDYNQSVDIDIGDSVFISSGSTLLNTTWAQNGTGNPVIGTDPILFTQVAGPGSYTAGNGISITGVSIAIDTAVTVDKTTIQTLTNKTLTSPTLTTPVLGTPSSGTLSSCTASTQTARNNSTSLATTAYADNGDSTIPQNSQSTAYTTVLSDAGKHIYHPSADTTARIWTIDSNSNVAYPIGTVLTFINDNSGGVITIAITSDTMRLAGAGTTGSRTLAANGIATATKLTSTSWIISGVGLT